MSATNETATKCFRFTVALAGQTEMTDEMQGRLLGVGCDAALWSEGKTVFLTFDRDEGTLGIAIGQSVDEIVRAGYAVDRIQIDPDGKSS